MLSSNTHDIEAQRFTFKVKNLWLYDELSSNIIVSIKIKYFQVCIQK